MKMGPIKIGASQIVARTTDNCLQQVKLTFILRKFKVLSTPKIVLPVQQRFFKYLI